jgi:NADPH:quinone reductase-like Zn-dependent oxidoreductase
MAGTAETATKTMRRWSLGALGGEHLRLETVAVPRPGPGEVRVAVRAVALNYRDVQMVKDGMGGSPPLPLTPGSDLAGEVVEVGAGVTRFRVGERVLSHFAPGWVEGRGPGSARGVSYGSLGGARQGVLAEQVVLHEDWLVAAPRTLPDAEASTLPVSGLTAWSALQAAGSLRQGARVLVQGTGGVSLFALQLAVAHGAEVFVTSGDDAKLARAARLGARHGVNRRREDWAEAVLRLTGDAGVDHVLEVAGGENLAQSLRAVAVGGHVSVIGFLDGERLSFPVYPLMLKRVTLQGVVVGHRTAMEALVRAVEAKEVRPVVDARYRFEQLHEALAHVERGAFGKVVVEGE